jgi:hypothetical protein
VRAGEDLLREANKSYRSLRESQSGKMVFDA